MLLIAKFLILAEVNFQQCDVKYQRKATIRLHPSVFSVSGLCIVSKFLFVTRCSREGHFKSRVMFTKVCQIFQYALHKQELQVVNRTNWRQWIQVHRTYTNCVNFTLPDNVVDGDRKLSHISLSFRLDIRNKEKGFCGHNVQLSQFTLSVAINRSETHSLPKNPITQHGNVSII